MTLSCTGLIRMWRKLFPYTLVKVNNTNSLSRIELIKALRIIKNCQLLSFYLEQPSLPLPLSLSLFSSIILCFSIGVSIRSVGKCHVIALLFTPCLVYTVCLKKKKKKVIILNRKFDSGENPS